MPSRSRRDTRGRRSKRLAIPRGLVIGGKRWRVRYMDHRAKRGDVRGIAGYCHRDERRIDIDRALDATERGQTLVHEILHAIWPEDVVPDAVEERIILRLEKPLHSLLVSGALVAVPEET